MLAPDKCLILCSGNSPNEDPLCSDIFRSGEDGEGQPNSSVRFCSYLIAGKYGENVTRGSRGLAG